MASMQYAEGIPSPMVMTARHLVNAAPREAYSASRSRRPSRPSVTFSSRGESQILGAHVDLDAGEDAARSEKRAEVHSVRRALAQRFVEEDDAADVFLDSLRREEKLTIGAPVLLGGFDADAVEALLNRARALVRREDAFARRHHLVGDFRQVVHAHDFAPERFAMR